MQLIPQIGIGQLYYYLPHLPEGTARIEIKDRQTGVIKVVTPASTVVGSQTHLLYIEGVPEPNEDLAIGLVYWPRVDDYGVSVIISEAMIDVAEYNDIIRVWTA